ncbi:BA14K family protein [Sinorhizobium glycinis]|uniref:BA14K family protein n=1 Tax=Sinorhizobium glycinis TaxID=1472378 RepID=UPI0009EF5277|nr:BA14K family protein [Sinorhizobium glycinis]
MKTQCTIALTLVSALAGAASAEAQTCIGICGDSSKHELFVERQYRDFLLQRYQSYGSRYQGRRPDISIGPGATVGGPLPGTAGTRPRRAIRLDLNAHLRWCLERYASYRLDDNSYQPFKGRRRQCNSPYD